MFVVNVYVSMFLPGQLYGIQQGEIDGRSREKNKVRDRILPPVVRTVGLMKMKKDNMNHSSVASSG